MLFAINSAMQGAGVNAGIHAKALDRAWVRARIFIISMFIPVKDPDKEKLTGPK